MRTDYVRKEETIAPTLLRAISGTTPSDTICLLPCIWFRCLVSRWSSFRYVWQTGDPFDAACNGCSSVCDGCSFEEPSIVPTCTEEMEHTSSAGGTTTLETLSIEPGYWRATASSLDVLACFHADACLGGATGTSGYCLEGYEGPCKILSMVL